MTPMAVVNKDVVQLNAIAILTGNAPAVATN